MDFYKSEEQTINRNSLEKGVVMNKFWLPISFLFLPVQSAIARCNYDPESGSYFWESPLVLVGVFVFVGWVVIKKIAPEWSKNNPYLSIFLIIAISTCLYNFVIFPGQCDSSGHYIE